MSQLTLTRVPSKKRRRRRKTDWCPAAVGRCTAGRSRHPSRRRVQAVTPPVVSPLAVGRALPRIAGADGGPADVGQH